MAADRDDKDRVFSDTHRKRRGRNIALLLVLAGLAVLFYIITIVKLTGSGG